MKIVRPICRGIYVHKNIIVATIDIGSVFSYPFGKSVQEIMKEVLVSDVIENV